MNEYECHYCEDYGCLVCDGPDYDEMEAEYLSAIEEE